MQAGFAEVDITPSLGTLKIGWLKKIVIEQILAPIYAKVVIFQSDVNRVAFVQLDTLFIAWPEVLAIRQGVEKTFGFPGAHIMVAATHNHAGPAVTHAGDVSKDETYVGDLVAKVIAAFGNALQNLEDVEVGFDHVYEWQVAHNRRVVMRNGTVKTHGTFEDKDALYIEGPIDPEVAVLAVRNINHELMGVIINFACHPTHHGGDTALHPGFPGVVAMELNTHTCPYTLFLNGASGNLHTANPANGGQGMSVEEAGKQLTEDVLSALKGMEFTSSMRLTYGAKLIDLPYRQVTPDEILGRIKGAQRFIDTAIYDRTIPPLLDQAQKKGVHRAEIQVIGIGDNYFVAVPGEYFVEYGLQIKEIAAPAHALVVSCANGRVGYIPTEQAFARGGYETTFGPSSMLAPEAGGIIVNTALHIIDELRK